MGRAPSGFISATTSTWVGFAAASSTGVHRLVRSFDARSSIDAAVERRRNGPRAVVSRSTACRLDRSLGEPGSAISLPHAEEALPVGFDQHRVGIGSAPRRWTTARTP